MWIQAIGADPSTGRMWDERQWCPEHGSNRLPTTLHEAAIRQPPETVRTLTPEPEERWQGWGLPFGDPEDLLPPSP